MSNKAFLRRHKNKSCVFRNQLYFWLFNFLAESLVHVERFKSSNNNFQLKVWELTEKVYKEAFWWAHKRSYQLCKIKPIHSSGQ